MLPFNFLTVNTRRQKKITHQKTFRIIRWWRIKVKNKRMKDRLRAMHQGMILILFSPFSHICLDCLPCQAWLITCVYMCDVVFVEVHHCHEWPCYCLIATPWFSYHFLHSILRFQGPVFRDHCPQDVCVRPQEKVICPIMLHMICHKCLMSNAIK